MTASKDIPCPCSSGDPYKNCCKPFHLGSLPKTALELMRSRFAAYALELPDYIIETTHRGNPEYTENKFTWKKEILGSIKNAHFQKLDILDFQEKEHIASVTFKAHIKVNAKDSSFTEKSYFEKIKGKWLYHRGLLGEAALTTQDLLGKPLTYYGNPILRKKGTPILSITPEIKTLVRGMIETMDLCDGVGIAAPQVGESLQLFVIRTPTENKKGDLELGEVQVFLNPILLEIGKETWKAEEGCLSIPGFTALVERPKKILLEYTSIEGEKIKKNFSGWEARAILHENDHIQGVLFIDHLSREEKAKLEPFLKKLETYF
jgi:peptide deformylase